MSWNFGYSVREALKGFGRARLATGVTISTVAITIFLLDICALFAWHVHRIVYRLKTHITLEVFPEIPPDSLRVQSFRKALGQIEGVASVGYISPEKALEIFQKEFGEDPLAFLGENPLPASFKLTLRPEYRNPDRVETIANQIGALPWVEEVVYHKNLFQWVEIYGQKIGIIVGSLAFIAFFSSVFLVSNTLRLILFSQREMIQIMKLIGATNGFIRRPYLIQGILQGGTGGLICTLFVWVVVKVVSLRFPFLLDHVWIFIWAPMGLGIGLGFIGSLWALRRYLRM